MESFFIKALQLIVSLSILVFIHEFGHYIFARMFGMRVNRFYLFFNPWFSLLKWYPDKGELQLIGWTDKVSLQQGIQEIKKELQDCHSEEIAQDLVKNAEKLARELAEDGRLSLAKSSLEEIKAILAQKYPVLVAVCDKAISDLDYITPRDKSAEISSGAKIEEPTTEIPRALVTIPVGKPHPKKEKKSSWRDTLYGIGWIPLGGYCDIAGMIDETKSATNLASEPQSWEFRSKAAWKRLLVMVAGVLFNFLLAIAIYIGIAWHWGDKVIQYQDATEGMDFVEQFHNIGFQDGDILLAINGKDINALDPSHRWDMVQPGTVVTVLRNHKDKVDITIPKGFIETIAQEKQVMAYRFPVIVDEVVGGEEAAKAGLKQGDRFLKVANDTTPSYTEFSKAMMANADKTVPLLVDRDGKPVELTAHISSLGKLGFKFVSPEVIYPIEFKQYTLWESIPRGWTIGTEQLANYVSSLKLVFSKEGAKSIGGFGALGSMFAPHWDWLWFWQISAFLSIVLAFMNILPIPALDGGHIMFTIWEILSGRKPSEKFLEVAQMIGMAFLLLLLVYANGNDLLRLFR